jgi:NADPH:quinone reductase-like Zn-dependent oxidoreductase
VFVGSRAMFEEMNQLIVRERIRPVIDLAFPLGDTVAAFRHLESGAHFGKIVIEL